jgi:hypothetical protein
VLIQGAVIQELRMKVVLYSLKAEFGSCYLMLSASCNKLTRTTGPSVGLQNEKRPQKAMPKEASLDYNQK